MKDYIKIEKDSDSFIIEIENFETDILIELASQTNQLGYSFKTTNEDEYLSQNKCDEAFDRWYNLIDWSLVFE
jgi:hypothetical protein